MKVITNWRQTIKPAAAVLLALPLTVALVFGTMLIHLQIYRFLNPGAITEMGHNYEFDRQVEIHFWLATPLFFVISAWVWWKIIDRKAKNA